MPRTVPRKSTALSGGNFLRLFDKAKKSNLRFEAALLHFYLEGSLA